MPRLLLLSSLLYGSLASWSRARGLNVLYKLIPSHVHSELSLLPMQPDLIAGSMFPSEWNWTLSPFCQSVLRRYSCSVQSPRWVFLGVGSLYIWDSLSSMTKPYSICAIQTLQPKIRFYQTARVTPLRLGDVPNTTWPPINSHALLFSDTLKLWTRLKIADWTPSPIHDVLCKHWMFVFGFTKGLFNKAVLPLFTPCPRKTTPTQTHNYCAQPSRPPIYLFHSFDTTSTTN